MVTGVKELERKLTKVFPALVEQRVREAMEKAADQVVAQMKARAPVYAGPPEIRSDKRHKGQPVIPGALRDSIAWTWGDAPKGTVTLGAVQTGLQKEGTTKLTIYAGNKQAFYARWSNSARANGLGHRSFSARGETTNARSKAC